MSLSIALNQARTEEDVKDAYIKALGLKSYSKNLVDIQTQEIWFEAKAVSTPSIVMFAQLMYYIRAARKRGDPLPAFLAVIDRDKAAIMPTQLALPMLDDKSIEWPKSGSQAGKELAAQIAPYVQTHIVEYTIAHDEAAFLKAVKDAIRERRIIRTPITRDNLRQVFDRWVDLIGTELGVKNQADYAVLFFADIMHDGHNEAMTGLPARLLMTAAGPTFLLNGQTYELASKRGYDNFWAIYHRPPAEKDRHYLLERRDSLLPVDEQKFKGAYYTPLHIVDKAYDQLVATLGPNWQDRYLVWDMCAGVGNLEAKHSNLRNVFMSTLDQADVTIMKSNPAFAGATIFQYDYLNDDVTDFGEIDYGLSDKLPMALRQAIPLANALSPTARTKDVRGRYWADGAIGSMICKGNDFQNSSTATAVLSSGYNSAGAFFVTEQNLWQAAIVFSVRRLIKPTWLNDRDQFLQPSEPLTDEFKTDCLVWMLFNGSNLTAGADGLRWDDRDWSLVNHFIPFTEKEVGATGRFESDFMMRYMAGMAFSPEAQAVLDEGNKLWTRFHAIQFPRKIRDEYKLGRPDAGWYQIRRALKAYGESELTDFSPFESAYAKLSAKLRPMVYELGFLPE